jgi:hypothetical protein
MGGDHNYSPRGYSPDTSGVTNHPTPPEPPHVDNDNFEPGADSYVLVRAERIFLKFIKALAELDEAEDFRSRADV